jgi:dephospho-CoA kinase
MFLNRKVKKIIKGAKEPLIIDFVALPILKVVKDFDKMYLLESDEEVRFKKLGERDGMTPYDAMRIDRLMEPYYKINDAFKFDDSIRIDYIKLPKKVDEVIENIKKSAT